MQTRLGSIAVLALVALGLVGVAHSTSAAVVTHSFSGKLTGTVAGNEFPGDFAIGNPFTVTVSYDDSVPDINSHPNVGLFNLGPSSILSATVIDSLNIIHTFSFDAASTAALIFDDYLGINRLDISGNLNADSSGVRIGLYLSDDHNQLISSDLLSAIDLGGKWSAGYLEITSPFGLRGGGIFAVELAIPEPSSYALTLSSLGLLLSWANGSRVAKATSQPRSRQ